MRWQSTHIAVRCVHARDRIGCELTRNHELGDVRGHGIDPFAPDLYGDVGVNPKRARKKVQCRTGPPYPCAILVGGIESEILRVDAENRATYRLRSPESR